MRRAHPGVAIAPSASTNLAVARWALAPDAQVVIEEGVVAERMPGALRVLGAEGASLRIGAGTWLRTEAAPVQIVVYAGAHVEIGPEGFLNGCALSAKEAIECGRRVWMGPGTRVYDADQHDIDADTPERSEPVRMGDFTWVASGVTVLKGATIGAHCVVGAHSLVGGEIPDHSLAFGVPARVRGSVGDRSNVLP